MRLLKKIIKERKGMGWLRSSMLLWCAGLGFYAADMIARLKFESYTGWQIRRVQYTGCGCFDDYYFNADIAHKNFAEALLITGFLLVIMLAVAVTVKLLRKYPKISFLLAVSYAMICLWVLVVMIPVIANDIMSGLAIMDFWTLAGAFAVLYSAIGTLLLAVENMRKEDLTNLNHDASATFSNC